MGEMKSSTLKTKVPALEPLVAESTFGAITLVPKTIASLTAPREVQKGSFADRMTVVYFVNKLKAIRSMRRQSSNPATQSLLAVEEEAIETSLKEFGIEVPDPYAITDSHPTVFHNYCK